MHPEDDNALNTEEKIWDLTMTINVKGVWWGCKYAILAMRNNPTDAAKGLHTGGSIINTASFVAIMGAATPQLACASPFRLLLLSLSSCLSFPPVSRFSPPVPPPPSLRACPFGAGNLLSADERACRYRVEGTSRAASSRLPRPSDAPRSS